MTIDQPARITGLFRGAVEAVALLDEIPLGLALLDSELRVIALNRGAEALLGITRRQARGIPCRHVLRNNLCLHNCPARRLTPEAQPLCLEGNIINRERQKIPVRVSFAAVLDLDGQPVGYLEALEDLRLLQQLGAGKARSYSFATIIGHCAEMQRIFQILPGIAQTDSSVLITGETGTGKDVLAEAIHQASARAKGPFVKVNCGALPETLLESELFGHRKGAFTGAVEHKPGRFRLAHNGSLFLTEVGDLPLTLQVKLLSFLDDKVIYPLGGSSGVQVDVRVVAATHRNLEQMARDGRFREDLLFRLNVVRLHLPPLRERGEDLRLLLDHFLRTLTSEFQRPIKGFSEAAMNRLLAYPYPGNVRELRNLVEYAVNICHEDTIEVRHLPVFLTTTPTNPAPAATSTESASNTAPAAELNHTAAPATAPARTWPEAERRLILDALTRAGGRRDRAAQLLGWGRSTLWRKMKHHEIDR